ncbi:hypothetical protein [Nocardia lasii]|uniref:Ferric oxidoreductase domain-containing protein n=1 Tax=Nocardia lasii TaxID=1616107 RepID=A0ABW1JUP1_9NOCA
MAVAGRDIVGSGAVEQSPGSWCEGLRLFGLLTIGLVAMALVILASAGWDTDGYRMVIRATARTSLTLFLSAFLATALLRLRPSAPTRWLHRNRRHLGLAFAVSHGVHLAAIITLATTDPTIFWTLASAASIIIGGAGYLVIALLVATSFDRISTWLGARHWQQVTTVGAWFIWSLFVLINGIRIPRNGWYLVPVAILVASLVVRVKTRKVPTNVAHAALN